jgi:hypothetical protein
MAGFGAHSDYFGLADTDWELQSSSLSPENSSAQALDENGDVSCETEYEQTASVECVYKLTSVGDESNEVELPANFQAGYVADFSGTKYVITGGSLATSNTERPILTVSGERLEGTDVGAHLDLYDFAGTIGAINAKKVATEIGFTKGTGNLLNSCSVAFSSETARALDADGAVAIKDVYAARIESTGELVACSTFGEHVVPDGWTKPRNAEQATSNTEYNSGSVMVYRNLAPAV